MVQETCSILSSNQAKVRSLTGHPRFPALQVESDGSLCNLTVVVDGHGDYFGFGLHDTKSKALYNILPMYYERTKVATVNIDVNDT